MNQVLIDTDVASYIFYAEPPSRYYLSQIRGGQLLLSFMSVAELRAGALAKKWGRRRQDVLEAYIEDFEIIYPDDRMCTLWATVTTDSRALGRIIAPQDAWVAATAIRLNAPLATNNRRHFEHVQDLQLISLPRPQ